MGYNGLELNVWKGETWFATPGTGTLGVSGTNVSIYLEPGTYEWEVAQSVYSINGGFLMLCNMPTGEYFYGPNTYSNSTYNGAQTCNLQAIFTITETTEFRLYVYALTAKSTTGLGISQNVAAGLGGTNKDEIYTTGQIRKLK